MVKKAPTRRTWTTEHVRTLKTLAARRNVPVAVEIGRQASIASGH